MDKQVYQLITNVPKVNKIVAAISAVLNVILPGLGTILTACFDEENVSKTQISVGVIQFFTSFVLIGWIWSIYWGYLIVMKGFDLDKTMGPGAPSAGPNRGGLNYPNNDFNGGMQYDGGSASSMGRQHNQVPGNPNGARGMNYGNLNLD